MRGECGLLSVRREGSELRSVVLNADPRGALGLTRGGGGEGGSILEDAFFNY